MIKLICFDLWQTLATIKKISISSSLKNSLKLNIEKEKVRRIYEEVCQTKEWKDEKDAAKQLCIKLEVNITEENINKIIEIFEKGLGEITIYPHVFPMFNKLKQKYKIGLISNTSDHPIKMLKKKRLLEDIDYPLFSFEEGYIKPDLRIFKKMLEISNCKPKEVIMVGDRLSDDVIPAKEVGMNTIHFKNYKQLKKDLKRFGVEI